MMYLDARIGEVPRVGCRWDDQGPILMRVPDEIRKCVVFLGTYSHENGAYVHRGTAFFVNKPASSQVEGTIGYLVTAKHNIEKAERLGLEGIYLRVNMKGGNSEWLKDPIPLRRWIFHADGSTDVAVYPVDIQQQWDHKAYPIMQEGENPDFGDEVFTVGLFWPHEGKQRALPVVRVGHVAAVGEEAVVANGLEQNAYLIESRSLGGLSGSPVFNWSDRAVQRYGETSDSRRYFFMGVNIAHFLSKPDDVEFDQVEDEETVAADSKKMRDALNAGLAIVVKKKKVLEILESDEMRKRDVPRITRIEKTLRDASVMDGSPDKIGGDPGDSDFNPVPPQ